jgi:hypothetical protein
MAAEPILRFRRVGFPKETLDEGSYRNVIEYIGPTDELSGVVEVGIKWGNYGGLVTSAFGEPIEGTDHSILTVMVERKFDSADYGDGGVGVKQETNYEIEWVDVQRPLKEHPAFSDGGPSALTKADLVELQAWEDEPDVDQKALYKFRPAGLGFVQGGAPYYRELSDNAKLYAKGRLLGIEYYIDKAPVARKSETYAGGPPPEADAGQKQEPDGFDHLPLGYEWIRTADRGIRRGGQTRWDRNIEWTGAKKVLIDRDEIFWSA